MTKAECRNIYKEKRISLSVEEKEILDQGILAELKGFDWLGVSYLHVYISIQKFNEPDTLQFVEYIRENFSSINIVLSKSDFENNAMVNYLWDDDLVLEENKWGILEPKSGILVEEDKIDAVIVPLLVSDMKGNRVGYGKGFYDRFLSKCKSTTKKIGISYFKPVEEITDVGEWDIPIDILVMPNSIYNIKK